jgi:hypothetical protein
MNNYNNHSLEKYKIMEIKYYILLELNVHILYAFVF